MNSSKKCFIMGLPNAGKTTFLAALWYSLNSAYDNNEIKLNIMTDTKYLADLSKKWVNAEPLDRTKLGYDQPDISIEIVDKKGDIFELRFPDLSGEVFQNHYNNREMSQSLVDDIQLADGIMVFINILDIDSMTLISALPKEYLETNKGKIQDDEHLTMQIPMQVQIIELLQFIEYIRSDKSVKIGIMLTAWDVIDKIGKKYSPENLIKEEMNMLWQFLEANRDFFDVEYWGVSAQGADLSEDEILIDIIEPMERIIVEDNMGNRSHDITFPIYKIVGGFQGE